MNLIQSLLILAVLVLVVTSFVRFRTALLDRLLVLFVSVVAAFFILFPTSTTWIAHRLGVGRGTDLVLYVVTGVFSFFFLLTYSKFLGYEREHTQLVRFIALKFPSRPEDRAVVNTRSRCRQ